MISSRPPELPGYKYLSEIGSGGFSQVFLYRQEMPRRQVAVKVLNSESLDERVMKAFRDEANVMARLEHDNIVSVYAADITSDGRPYLIMSYYPPPDLAKRVEGKGLSVPVVLRYGIQLAGALETAHRADVVHRDIKPANILLGKSDAPILIDFGIAGNSQSSNEEEELGVSLPWSPPEVLDGRSNGSVVTDVYSLGATLWHLLVGRSPFNVPGGDNSPKAMMGRILTMPPPATGVPECPATLERALQLCMNKRPELRPKTAYEVAVTLQSIEKALGYSRTELEVVDLEPDDDDVSPAHRRPPPPPPAPVASPATSNSAGPRQEVAMPTTRRPLVAATDGASAPAQPNTHIAQLVAPGETVVRQVETGLATTRRPTTAPLPERATTDGETSGKTKMWVLAGLGVALAGGSAVWLAGLGEDTANEPTDPQTFEPAPDDLGGVSAKPELPAIDVVRKGQKLVFTWQEQEGVRYVYSTSANPGDERKARSPVRLDRSRGSCITLKAINAAGTTEGQVCE